MDSPKPEPAPLGHRLPNVLGLELATIIEQRIIRLEMVPGSHVTEQQICDEFNVSRSPVREAFRELEAIGLVVRHTRRGIRVTPMTHEDLHEVYFCRIPLEALAASVAAKNATEADIAFLVATLGALDRSLDAGDSEQFFHNNVALINRIHLMTGQKLLQNILNMIEKQAMRYRYFAHAYSKSMQATSARRLHEVVDAIRVGDADLAHERTETMMRDAHVMIAAVLDDHPDLATAPSAGRSLSR